MNVVLSKLRILSQGEGHQMESILRIREAWQYAVSSCQKGNVYDIGTILWCEHPMGTFCLLRSTHKLEQSFKINHNKMLRDELLN
jgi:hypothetical protein